MEERPHITGYRVEHELGHGGMATVYLAVQENLNRNVAIKVLSPVLLADKQFIHRFLQEAEMAANLRHANIIPIYDVGRSGDFNYIVMEYMEGSLKDKLRRGPVDTVEAFQVVTHIARALDYAHGEGFVHRDIKPENIMFRRDGTAILTDFGIARAVDQVTKLTKTGMSIGTPHYMSPEQARGKALDGRADIYSLGVVLYEMLTGKVPFDAEDSVAVAIMHIQEPIPRLPARLSRFQPLLERMMAKEREVRVQTGGELIRLIEELKMGEDSISVPRQTVRRAGEAGNVPAPGREGKVIFSSKKIKGDAQIGRNRSRSILLMGLGVLLFVSIGLLVTLTRQGRQKPGVIVASTPSQEKPSSLKASGGEVKEPAGAIPVTSGKEENDALDAFLREKYKNYLDQAEKYYESGDYERANRNVELAGGIKRTTQVEAFQRRIESAISRGSKQGADQASTKKEIDRKQAEVQAEDAAWSASGAMGGAGTKEALQKYLMDYPSGRHASEARQRLEEFKAAESAKTEEAEREKRAEEERRKDDAAWSVSGAIGGAGTKEALQKYLMDYPTGRHAAEARQRLGYPKAAEERREAVPLEGQIWQEPVTGMEFVFIPGGEFYMGSDNWDLGEKPVHKVYVDGFWLGKYEVTQGHWQAVMGSNPSYFKYGKTNPVEQVSWEDAQDFIWRLNAKSVTKFRLPTEAEWEYASRAGTSWDSYSSLNDIGWGKANSSGAPHFVGQKRPNFFGLYDMLGNVWEWCQDIYGNYSSEYARNPAGPSTNDGSANRVIRGGSYRSDGQYLRSACRNLSAPSLRYNHLGFRLARTK